MLRFCFIFYILILLSEQFIDGSLKDPFFKPIEYEEARINFGKMADQVGRKFSEDNIDKWVFQENINNFVRHLKKREWDELEKDISVFQTFCIGGEPNFYAKKLCNGDYTWGLTPLAYVAALHSNTEFMKILLEFGADPNKIDSFGYVPWHYTQNKEKIDLLKKYGAQRVFVTKLPSRLDIRTALDMVFVKKMTQPHEYVIIETSENTATLRTFFVSLLRSWFRLNS